MAAPHAWEENTKSWLPKDTQEERMLGTQVPSVCSHHTSPQLCCFSKGQFSMINLEIVSWHENEILKSLKNHIGYVCTPPYKVKWECLQHQLKFNASFNG